MNNTRKFTVPLLAESLIKGLQIAELPIDPKVIARGRGIEVVAKPMENSGCSGMLVRYGNEFAIAYATHLENEGFENFSVAHELGHYYLPGHMDAVIGNEGTHVSRAGFTSTDRYEREADQFAAAFLMPRHLFFPQLIRAGSGLNAIIALAELCKTSLHSTAIRYTECTRDPVAIIISENNIIDHCFMSPAIKNLAGLDWVKRGQHVSNRTTTFSFNRRKENIVKASRMDGTSNLQHWFGGTWDVDVQENVKGLGGYGKTLTVLHDIELPDPEDAAFESELIESWTPRFK
jgi:hypothetical protein